LSGYGQLIDTYRVQLVGKRKCAAYALQYTRTDVFDVVAALVNFSEEPRRPCTTAAASSRPTNTPHTNNHSSFTHLQ
jgi:hypothetical protein